jgi:hypothetical protein
MTVGLGQTALPGPAPIAVHDDGDMARQGERRRCRGFGRWFDGRPLGRCGVVCLRPMGRRH